MSDVIDQRAHVPADPPAPVFGAEERAALMAEERKRMQAEIEQIRLEARLEVQREHARLQRQQKLEAFAQHVTSPTFDRRKALPLEASALGTFLVALDAASPELCTQAQTFLTRILTADLIDFAEHGSQGDEGERDVKAEWDAAVKAKTDAGSSRSAAIEAIKREQPQLFLEYNASGATYTKKEGRR